MSDLPKRVVENGRELFEWQQALLKVPLKKHAMTNGDKVVGMRLSLHRNRETGLTFPSINEALAPGTAMSRQYVQGAIARLVDGKWIRRTDRPGTSPLYTFLLDNVP